MTVRSVPTWYRGTRFASSLEADWARTFDTFGWVWQYEPEALALSSGEQYRPDFYLPGQRVWCEVKGPHDERRHKATQLHRELHRGETDEWRWHVELVVVLRPPGPGETAMWDRSTDNGQDIVIVLCPECRHYCFMDYNGFWVCRHHFSVSREPNQFWRDGGEILWPGDAKFVRVPRREPRGAA